MIEAGTLAVIVLEAVTEGEIEAVRETEALAERLAVAATLAVREVEPVSEALPLDEGVADGEMLADGITLGETEALSVVLGEVEALGDAVVDGAMQHAGRLSVQSASTKPPLTPKAAVAITQFALPLAPL